MIYQLQGLCKLKSYDGEIKRLWAESVVVHLNMPSQHVSAAIEKEKNLTSVRIVGFRTSVEPGIPRIRRIIASHLTDVFQYVGLPLLRACVCEGQF
jgi:hypothetical protein